MGFFLSWMGAVLIGLCVCVAWTIVPCSFVRNSLAVHVVRLCQHGFFLSWMGAVLIGLCVCVAWTNVPRSFIHYSLAVHIVERCQHGVVPVLDGSHVDRSLCLCCMGHCTLLVCS